MSIDQTKPAEPESAVDAAKPELVAAENGTSSATVDGERGGDGEDKKSEDKWEGEVGERSELRALQERYKKGSVEVITTAEFKASDFDEHSGYALVSMQKFSEKGRLEKTLLTVNSAALLHIFRKVIVSHPSVPSGFDAPVEMESPFMALFHNWDELEAYNETVEDETERKHLAMLLEFMDSEMGKRRKEVRKMVQNGSIDYWNLWTIFKPGQLVYSTAGDHPMLLKLEKTVYEDTEKCGNKFEIHCTHTINDGTGIYRRANLNTFFEKRVFGGGTSAKITSLSAYPFDFFKSGLHLKKEMEERGRKAKDLSGVLVVKYNGAAQYQKLPPRFWYSPDPDEYDTVWLTCKETGRVILDGKTYLEDYSYEASAISQTWPDEYNEWAEKMFGSRETADLVLCAPFVFGYSLQRKDWCKFFIDHLSPIQWKDDAVDSLVMSSQQKALLNAVVTSHEYPENPRETAEQKGKGLVILLHGTPGSGKTLTAEVAAEAAHTALLSISLGELYEDQWFNEWKLKELLQYATIWKSVVLIDEADIFLEARTGGKSANSDRNALVAVFLRYLEYFSGIVFLTSNRVEEFDAAMKSRIHLALQYDPPALELRRQIWASRLSKVPANEISFDIASTVETLLTHDMNGREIANAINTARTLARYEGSKLQVSHVKTVVDIWTQFNSNLDELKAKRKAGKMQTSFAGPVTNGVHADGDDEKD